MYVIYVIFPNSLIFTVNFCKINFLHKSLVQILTQTPFSLVHFNKYLFRAARPPPKKKHNGTRKYKQSQIIQLSEIVSLLN